jgi:acetoin utilization protein AcuC
MGRRLFVHGPVLDGNGYPEECPFNTSRAGRTCALVRQMGLLEGDDRGLAAPVALTRAELERFHTAAYLDGLQRAGDGTIDPRAALELGLGTPDCPLFKGMYDYVALAAGATVVGAREILAGRADVAFNPSGGFHHAQPGNAAGFCYVNDVVLAAQELAAAGKRVLFLDIDVHHCDGVQNAFIDRRDVMTISLHESGRSLFPGTGFEDETGVGEGRGYTVNFPLPVGTYDLVYERIFRDGALPLIRAFNPDVIVLELGMDALSGDPLAHLHLTNNVHALIVEELLGLGRPILATGGGGYHIENTVRGWALCWSVLCGEHSLLDDLAFGMGGVMLENTDWIGGLRDRVLLADGGRRDTVDAEIDRVLNHIRARVFPLHGL